MENDDAALTDLCWKTFIQLVQREEFNLSYMGLSGEEIANVRASSDGGGLGKGLAEKVNLRLKYQHFLYQTLRACLNSFTRKIEIEN